MISEFQKIAELFEEISKALNTKVRLFVIGGAVLLYQGLKSATKDVDLVVETKEEFVEFQRALKKSQFVKRILETEYKHMNLNQIFQREDFRIDLFQKEVCGQFSLSKGMMHRAKDILNLENLKVSLCSNEDIFLFKTMTEREGDLGDCIILAQTGIEWNTVLKELKEQIEQSKQDVWVTWVGERLDLLEEKGLVIKIKKEIDKLRENFFDKLEKNKL